ENSILAAKKPPKPGATGFDGIFQLALSDYHDPINIGNPREMTILESANKILQITGSKSEIIKKPLSVDDPKVRKPDIRRARTLLGWEPKIDFETRIRETICISSKS